MINIPINREEYVNLLFEEFKKAKQKIGSDAKGRYDICFSAKTYIDGKIHDSFFELNLDICQVAGLAIEAITHGWASWNREDALNCFIKDVMFKKDYGIANGYLSEYLSYNFIHKLIAQKLISWGLGERYEITYRCGDIQLEQIRKEFELISSDAYEEFLKYMGPSRRI